MYVELKPRCNVCGHHIQIKRALLDVEGEAVLFIGDCPICQKTRYAVIPISDLYLLAVKMKIKLKKGNGKDNDTS